MIGRRQAIFTFGGAAFAAWLAGCDGIASGKSNQDAGKTSFGNANFRGQIEAIEAKNGGRLGVAVLDTASGARFSHRGDERFPMCSTFKFLLAAATLARADGGSEKLDRRISYARTDLVAYSPVTEKHVGEGMTIEALCEATMTTSDNGAANLLLAALGGTSAFNAFVAKLGDGKTRLDRIEPALNEALPDDARDTTTPLAMLGDMNALLIGDALATQSRNTLLGWLIANKTGGKRLRAGLPSDWRVGDKTGTGERGSANDIGILWPRGRPPILVTSYLTGGTAPDDANNAVHAAVARAIAEAVSPPTA